MPPKKDAKETLVLDTNPFGAFVNVSVEKAVLELELPDVSASPAANSKSPKKVLEASPSDGPPAPPKTHIQLSYPGDWAPLVGEHTDAAEGGVYAYRFNMKFRREPSMDALLELINSSLNLSVHDSATNTVLATAAIDVLPFGLGASEIKVGDMTLEPNPALPEGVAKVVSGSLRGVRVWLTQRDAPPTLDDTDTIAAATAAPTASGTVSASSSRPSTSASPRSKPGTKGGAADEPIPESDLPVPHPYTFIPPDLVPGSTVVELSVGEVAPLPPNAAAVFAAGTEGKSGGKLTVSVGLALPGGPPVVVTGGVVVEEGGRVTFAAPRRREFVSREQVAALLAALEDGQDLRVEVARFLVSDILADPAWDAFHAAADIPGTAHLLAPGATQIPPADPLPLTLFPADQAAHSCLPSYTLPNAKNMKNIEEAPPAGTCPWALAGSRLTGVSVRVAVPLIPPWQPPSPPQQPLLTTVPPRPHLTSSHEPADAMESFKEEVQRMAKAVAALQLRGDVALPLQPTDPVGLAPLAEDLGRGGRLNEIRHALKQGAVRVALEKLRADLNGTPLDDAGKAEKLRALHTLLSTAMTSALEDLVAAEQVQEAPPPTAPSVRPATAATTLAGMSGNSIGVKLDRLASWSWEYEVQGVHTRAEALQQRRVLDAQHADRVAFGSSVFGPAALYDYAAFCMRCGNEKQGRAEELFRLALESDPHHAPSMAALSALLLHQGLSTDPLHLYEAADLARQLAKVKDVEEGGEGGVQEGEAAVCPHEPLAAGLLMLITQALEDEARAEDVAFALGVIQQVERVGLHAEVHQRNMSSAGLQSPSPKPPQGEGSGVGVGLPSEASRLSNLGSPGPATSAMDLVYTLAPGASPSSVNALLAVAELAAELALPAVALTALEMGVSELPDSSNTPEVALEMDLTAARAFAWMSKWERENAVRFERRAASEPEPEEPEKPEKPESESETAPLRAEHVSASGSSVTTQPASDKQVSPRASRILGPQQSVSVENTSMPRSLNVAASSRSLGGMSLAYSVGATSIARSTRPEFADSFRSTTSTVAGAAAAVVAARPKKLPAVPRVEEPPTFALKAAAARQRAESAFTHALELCKTSEKVSPPSDMRVHMIRGDVLFHAGRWREAVLAYSPLLKAGSSDTGQPPLSAFLHMAAAYQQLGRSQYALDVYLQTCAQQPCASAWLGVAQARLELGNVEAAEAALTKAVGLDPESPVVWGELAKVAIKQGRVREASAALATGLRFGLRDVDTLQQLAKEFGAAGSPADVRVCLEAVVAIPGTPVMTRVALAELLMKEHDVLAARLHLEAAARDAATEQEMAAVHAQVPRLIDLQMNLRAC